MRGSVASVAEKMAKPKAHHARDVYVHMHMQVFV